MDLGTSRRCMSVTLRQHLYIGDSWRREMRRERPIDDIVSSRSLHALMMNESDKISLIGQKIRNDSCLCHCPSFSDKSF